ncbi:DUF4383 domain-containing protein [Paenactinomyces guangxiensis]|uniref:DUF4383 domain-containing protein n=1 Tax=Paenactinomyces guangxiensis TaxID=1490290 RepID=A0A7W2A8Z0_9BACL|nr:DUF4383 domain-containing protein [Paenactinomyces guangxiensis]MBA4494657.1 DUF4383 domain-containing protein [Paenactinomyces guangxiensis]MBH8591741.1 DUF4383 domain-containing protein [Paenactinomyces guangxiensis]
MAQPLMRVLGVIFVLAGVIGYFVPLEGFLHLTATHNIIHLITGIIFLAVSNSEHYSMWVSRIFGIVYLLVAILGLFTDNNFGLMMSTPATDIIHFIIGALAAYAGFKKPASSAEKQNQSV